MSKMHGILSRENAAGSRLSSDGNNEGYIDTLEDELSTQQSTPVDASRRLSTSVDIHCAKYIHYAYNLHRRMHIPSIEAMNTFR